MFEACEISTNNSGFRITVKSKIECSNLNVEIRLKDMGRFLMTAHYNQFSVKVNSIKNLHTFDISFDDINNRFILNDLKKQIVWIYIKYDNKFYEIKLNDSIKKIIKDQKSSYLNLLATINLIKRDNNTLGISIKSIDKIIELKDISVSNNFLKIEVENYESSAGTKNVNIKNVYLKKRIFKNVLKYADDIKLLKNDKNSFVLDLTKLDLIKIDEVSNLDFLVEYSDEQTSVFTLLKSSVITDVINRIFIFDNYKTKLYLTTKNTISIRVEKLYQVTKCDIYKYNEFEVDVDLSELVKVINGTNSNISISVYRINKIYNDYEYIKYNELLIASKNKRLTTTINLKSVFGHIKCDYTQEYKILMKVDDILYNVKFNESLKINLILDNSIMKIDFATSGIIKLSRTTNTVNLGILGSCFSRAPFNSNNEYYNPDYKTYYNIAYSHFWPSVLSLTSSAIEFNIEEYKDVTEKDIKYIKREYEKSTFDEMKSVKLDFLVIDFFVDAIHGVRKIKDKVYLGHNGVMHNTMYYKNILLKETEQFDYRNTDYFREWMDRCDKFISILKNIIDEERIILNLGGLSKLYLDNNDVKSFAENKSISNQDLDYYNLIWTKMNNYFLTKLPSAKIIDMSKYEYKSSTKHPISLGPHHYEHAYYKSFIGELSKIIIPFRN